MRIVPARSPWARLAATFGAFALGPLLGIAVGAATTPDSQVVQTVAPFAFAVVFAGGIVVWLGIGAIVMFGRLLRRGRSVPGSSAGEEAVPPGYRAFVVLGVMAGAVVGVIAGLATSLSVIGGLALWVAAGLAYGGALWAAAHHGYLPFPELE